MTAAFTAGAAAGAIVFVSLGFICLLIAGAIWVLDKIDQ